MRLYELLLAATLLKNLSLVNSESSDDFQLLKQQVQDMQQQMTTEKQQLAKERMEMQNKFSKFEAENLKLKQDVSDLSDKVRVLGNQHLGNTVHKLENITLKLKQDNLKLHNVSGKRQHNGTFISFSAYASETIAYDSGSIVLFEMIITNEGSLYSPETSTFTCVIPGYYMFSLSVLADTNKYMVAEIVVDGSGVVAVFGSVDDVDQGSNTVIVLCPAPSQVFVRAITSGSEMTGEPNNAYSTFTGLLLVQV